MDSGFADPKGQALYLERIFKAFDRDNSGKYVKSEYLADEQTKGKKKKKKIYLLSTTKNMTQLTKITCAFPTVCLLRSSRPLAFA